MSARVIAIGPGLVQLDLDSAMTPLQDSPELIDFSKLTSAPLTVTLSNPDGASASFTELRQ